MTDTSLLDTAIIAAAKAITQRQVTFKAGTIDSVTTNQNLVNVFIDGDAMITDDNGQDDMPVNGFVACQVLIGSGLIPSDRVMVMFAPPSGAYVIGRYAGDYNAWVLVGAGFPPFAANWTTAANVGIPGQALTWQTPSFRRTGRLVELRGRTARTAGGGPNPDTMFTLPVNHRPSNDLVFTSINGPIAGLGYVIVRSTGEVQSFTVGNENFLPNGYVSLDGMFFTIDVGT